MLQQLLGGLAVFKIEVGHYPNDGTVIPIVDIVVDKDPW
jgi:hypothetical protein